jgi:predicted tellurium resistance membrane protein TerC
MFGQTFEAHDLVVIGLLVILEGVLSIDNALVLGLLAKRLPRHQQKRALTYGLVGAFVFRLLAVATAAYLLKWRIVKLLGGGYLIYIAVKHLFFESREEEPEHIAATADGDIALVDQEGRPVPPERARVAISQRSPIPIPPANYEEAEQTPAPAAAAAAGVLPYQTPSPGTARQPDCDQPGARRKCASFWPTVVVIELTDIAFAVDSILAAIALVGSAPAGHTGTHPKLWVVLAGGMLGVLLMRVAAVMFIKLLDRFPRFETAAYLLVVVIGAKLLADWGFNSEAHPHRLDFHSYQHPAFWVFWGLMIASFAVGFIPKKGHHRPAAIGHPPA